MRGNRLLRSARVMSRQGTAATPATLYAQAEARWICVRAEKIPQDRDGINLNIKN
jgi:hypothetical protein